MSLSIHNPLELEIVDEKSITDRWIGKHVVANAKTGSYFCILKSIKLGESYLDIIVEDAWLVTLGRQKTPDNELIKNCYLSTIMASRVNGGREFEIKEIINIDTSEDTINKVRRIIEDINS